jgi:hypothetical protein
MGKGSTLTRTASSGVAIERRYTGEDARYEHHATIVVAGDQGIAGISDPILTEPIDFEAELAERERTHEPLGPVDTDLTNTLFGI